MPIEYLFEPWKAPHDIQQSANCIVGTDYPHPMVDHKQASRECRAKMEVIKNIHKGNTYYAYFTMYIVHLKLSEKP